MFMTSKTFSISCDSGIFVGVDLNENKVFGQRNKTESFFVRYSNALEISHKTYARRGQVNIKSPSVTQE
ncbi:CLUMA_CG013125, isoform A [Clunio marinus]|uniref:CLUMA_CG013125, isoform A n=1 Tax=Clunio marinus TaxID=568069 RepID=A0A1J1IMW6_9DIPT|nr:CLUMA_CG013125, isoform A [Clunio marinus]